MIHLPDDEINQVLIQTVRNTGLSLKFLGRSLGLTSAQLLAQISGHRRLIGAKEVESLESLWGISFDQLKAGTYDSPSLKARMLGDYRALPSRYAHAKYSFIRTTSNIVEYLQFTQGWEFTRRLLAKLEVHENLFEFDADTINFLFFTDLFGQLESMGIEKTTLKKMAYQSAVKNRKTPLGQKFKSTRSDHELYQTLQRQILLYDSNFDYKVEVTESKATLFTHQRERVQDELKISLAGTRTICLYKQYVFASLPLYCDRPILRPKETRCMYQGDPHCEYYVEFPAPRLRLISSEFDFPR